jgi:NAD(P)-dependent dehydrogenase (short-subunit alcohol dehydrogenase family)
MAKLGHFGTRIQSIAVLGVEERDEMKDISLTGRVIVVTGASRGLGAGIAQVLGEAGATVYVTGRSTRALSNPEGIPGTIEDSAEAVSQAGGKGVPVAVDHTGAEQVEALFRRVRAEQGRLDVLVNNAWGGYEHHDLATFLAPFWEQPVERWEAMFTSGVRAALLSSRYAAPLMIEQGSGLIVNTVAWAFGEYLGNLYYDAAKGALVRISAGMARELRPHNVAALALAAGFMRTERVMLAHQRQPFPLDGTESTVYTGRAVAALATDPNILAKSGGVFAVGDLAREYGFTDVDGRQPEAFRLPDG